MRCTVVPSKQRITSIKKGWIPNQKFCSVFHQRVRESNLRITQWTRDPNQTFMRRSNKILDYASLGWLIEHTSDVSSLQYLNINPF